MNRRASAQDALDSAISNLESATDAMSELEEILADLDMGEHPPPKALTKAQHKAERALHHLLAYKARHLPDGS